jgi:recombination protein RecA
MAAFIDAEHALDPTYAKKLGVDLDELLVSQPDTGEQALDIAEMLVVERGRRHRRRLGRGARAPGRARGRDGRLARRPAGAPDEPGAAQAHRHDRQARTPHLHQPDPREDRRDVRQPRDDPGRPRAQVLQLGAHGHPPHRPDQERRSGVGNRTKVKVVKNKVAPPFRKVEFDIIYNKGISRIGDVLDLALDHKIVQRSGAWFSYGETRLGQGRERVVEMLEENTDLLETIQTQVFAAIEEAERARENKGKNGPEPRKMQGTGA